MNELIQRIFKNFSVNGVEIPVSYMFYEGHGEPYIVYMEQDAANSLSGDDNLIAYVDYYDFDVYSTKDYTEIINRMKEILEKNNFRWQPSRSSQDMYDVETRYYHKTLNFAIHKIE